MEGVFSEERSESPDLKRQSSAAKRLAHAALDPQPTATQAQPRNSTSLGSGFEYKRSSVDQARTGVRPVESETKVAYVDKGYQPSPPTSPPARSRRPGSLPIPRIQEPEAEAATAKALQGDFRDKALMGISLVLFCVIGAQMFSLYAYWYYHAGSIFRSSRSYSLCFNVLYRCRCCRISNFLFTAGQ